MPYHLLTFRAHPNDSKLFEEFMDYFPPLLDEYPSYAWVVEEDNTLNKHFHAVIETVKTKSKKTFFEKFNNKNLKKYKEMVIRSTNTQSQGFDNRKVEDTQEDLLKCVGYTQKEGTPERSGVKGFTREFLEKAYHFYKVDARVKKASLPEDTILLTLKNAYAHIPAWCRKNDIRPSDPTCLLRMNHSGYAFEPIGSTEKIHKVLDEIDRIMFPISYPVGKPVYTYDELKDALFKSKQYANLLYEQLHQHKLVPIMKDKDVPVKIIQPKTCVHIDGTEFPNPKYKGAS